MGQITKVTPDMIQVANNVTSKTVGNTTSGISLTFDSNGVITSAANVTLSVANTQLTGTINSAQIASNTISNTNIATGAVENYLRANALDFGMRNRIINGAMAIDQRQLGSALTVSPSATGYFGLDRWNLWSFPSGAAGTWTWQRLSTGTPPTGFTYYGRATVTTADSSVTGTDYYTIQQVVEGFNTADFEFGTANAKPFTVSFWVRSSVTGTFSCSTYFANAGQGYPLTYTINSANTWEYKTLSFPALTSSSISNTDKTNAAAIYIVFALGLGSNYVGTAGVLNSSAYGASGATNLISTNGATFDITGIQMELGTTATPFERRPYGTELGLCQRYFEKSYDTGTAVGTNTSTSSVYNYASTDQYSSLVTSVPFKVEKRAAPTMTAYLQNGTSGSWDYGRSGATGTATVVFYNTGTSRFTQYMTIGASAYASAYCYGHWTASAEL